MPMKLHYGDLLNVVNLADLDLLSIGNSINIAGVLYSGEGKMYLCPLPNAEFLGSEELAVLKMNAEDWTKFLRQTDVQEIQVSSPDGLKKAILRKSNRIIDAAVSWAVFRRDAYQCRYCGNNSVPLTVDHLVAWEEGGPSTAENMVTSCKRCNKMRGNKSYADWLASDYYLQASRALTPDQKFNNTALLATLDQIKKVDHIRSR